MKRTSTVNKKNKLRTSKLQVFDISVDDLIGDELNPNEMKEDKFDLLVQEIQDSGFDEPIIVIPHPSDKGKYLIAGGHHRVKAARVAGMDAVPSIVKEDWDEDAQKIALVKRNILHGDLNSEKFTKLYNDLAKKYDPKLLQSMMAFTQKDEFNKVYEGVEKSLSPKQRKTLASSKEKIKSVDDLTSVLHQIFKEQGSESDHSYMVFSYGGKEHHYVQIGDKLNAALKEYKQQLGPDESMSDALQGMLLEHLPSSKVRNDSGKKTVRKTKKRAVPKRSKK